MKRIFLPLSVGFCMVLFTSCAMTPRKDPSRLTTTTFKSVRTVDAAGSTLSGWEDRLALLKKSAVSTNSDDRHSAIEKKITKMDSKLENARSEFIKLKLADASDQKKHFDKINELFEETTQLYNSALAE